MARKAKKRVKRRSVFQRRLARLNRITVRALDRGDASALSKLADRYENYGYEGEAAHLRNKLKRM